MDLRGCACYVPLLTSVRLYIAVGTRSPIIISPHSPPRLCSESTVALPHAGASAWASPHTGASAWASDSDTHTSLVTHQSSPRHNPPRDRTDHGRDAHRKRLLTLVQSHTVLFPLVHSPLPIRTLSNTPLSSVAVRSVLAIGRPPSSQLTARCFEARAESSIDAIHAHKRKVVPPLDRRAKEARAAAVVGLARERLDQDVGRRLRQAR